MTDEELDAFLRNCFGHEITQREQLARLDADLARMREEPTHNASAIERVESLRRRLLAAMGGHP